MGYNVFAVGPHYLDTAKLHLGVRGPKQLFFHLTTTYWVKQSTQPSLAIPLEVPRAYAKSPQLSLPYLILMSSLRHTKLCHYHPKCQIVLNRSFVSLVIAAFFFFLFNDLLESDRGRNVTRRFWTPSAGCSNWPSQPINFPPASQTPSSTFPVDRPYNVLL